MRLMTEVMFLHCRIMLSRTIMRLVIVWSVVNHDLIVAAGMLSFWASTSAQASNLLLFAHFLILNILNFLSERREFVSVETIVSCGLGGGRGFTQSLNFLTLREDGGRVFLI